MTFRPGERTPWQRERRDRWAPEYRCSWDRWWWGVVLSRPVVFLVGFVGGCVGVRWWLGA